MTADSLPSAVQVEAPVIPETSPFHPDAEQAYQAWRRDKLASKPKEARDYFVTIKDPAACTEAELDGIGQRCQYWNMAIYQLDPRVSTGKSEIRRLAAQLGLTDLDDNLCADGEGISSLEVREDGLQRNYIPYSSKPLNWHTDGYYYTGATAIRGILMHCVRDAPAGGDNAFLDHEMLYIMLRDENPDWIRALMQKDAMVVPANTGSEAEQRSESVGPVFTVDAESGRLHMRYTARTRSICWKEDLHLAAAREEISRILSSDSPAIVRYHLKSGEGIICNNVLHSRTSFADDDGRLLFRARFRNRVSVAAESQNKGGNYHAVVE